MKPKRQFWTDFDSGLLMILWLEGAEITEIQAAFPERTLPSLYQHKDRLGLPNRVGRASFVPEGEWSPAEDAVLRELRNRGVTASRMMKSLPGRTVDAIHKRIARLKLPRKTARRGVAAELKVFEVTTRLTEAVYQAMRRRLTDKGVNEADYLRDLIMRDTMSFVPPAPLRDPNGRRRSRVVFDDAA